MKIRYLVNTRGGSRRGQIRNVDRKTGVSIVKMGEAEIVTTYLPTGEGYLKPTELEKRRRVVPLEEFLADEER